MSLTSSMGPSDIRIAMILCDPCIYRDASVCRRLSNDCWSLNARVTFDEEESTLTTAREICSRCEHLTFATDLNSDGARLRKQQRHSRRHADPPRNLGHDLRSLTNARLPA